MTLRQDLSTAPAPRIGRSPFEAAVAGMQDRPGTRTKAELLTLSFLAERRSGAGAPGTLVLVSLQDARFWTPRTSAAYREIAAAGSTVVAFGVGLPTSLDGPYHGRVATVGIDEEDVLADEWIVLFRSAEERWGFVSREAAAGLPSMRSARRVPAEARFGPGRHFHWASVREPLPLQRASSSLLSRVPDRASLGWPGL